MVLFGASNLGFLTLKIEELKEHKMLNKIFALKKVKVRAGWKCLRNEELLNLCCSLNTVKTDQIKEDEVERSCSV
jgi:hypothetical protein